MERRILPTADGSLTISVPELQVTYHSVHGAIRESQHVFIDAGLKMAPANCRILEMGFGTGLNALLTLLEAGKDNRHIFYESIETYPLEESLYGQLNYCDLLQRPDLKSIFLQFHSCEWEKEVAITSSFTLKKVNQSLLNFSGRQLFDLIYFDAFAPNAQPELWSEDVFRQLFAILKQGGILVTYCSKGIVRRSMQAAGFSIEKLPGPPGKREMIRCRKAN